MSATAPPHTRAETRRAMRLSLVDAFFFSAMVGAGEFYFLANSVRLGASHLEQALVITLPLCVGALGPWLALAAALHLRRRKKVVVASACGQATVLAAIVISDHHGMLSPAALIALACAYQVFGQGAGTAWSSWYGEVVPAALRGRYFARRNRVVHVGTFASLVCSGGLLHLLEPAAAGAVSPGAGGAGYAVIFSAAALFRLISALVLASSPEAAGTAPVAHALERPAARAAGTPTLRRILATAALLQLTVYLASPYFGPFMLDELRLSYPEYTIVSVAVVALKFVSLHGWGRAIDRYGARSVYLLAVMLVALVPVPWLWARGVGVVFFAQALSGFSWGGHEVAHFSLLLETTRPDSRLRVFATMNTLNGFAQMSGSLLGAALLSAWPTARHGFFAVFAASAICRLGIAAAAPTLIPAKIGATGIGRRRLLLRLLGVRPSGGIDHRPLAVEDLSTTPQAREETAPRPRVLSP